MKLVMMYLRTCAIRLLAGGWCRIIVSNPIRQSNVEPKSFLEGWVQIDNLGQHASFAAQSGPNIICPLPVCGILLVEWLIVMRTCSRRPGLWQKPWKPSVRSGELCSVRARTTWHAGPTRMLLGSRVWRLWPWTRKHYLGLQNCGAHWQHTHALCR